MANRIDFYPPKPSPPVIRLAYFALPFVLRYLCGVCRVVISNSDLERVDQATKQSCIITPNHPSRVEPMIVTELARRLHRTFYFVSARENFEQFGGRILQKVGAYSIARGLPDRPSLTVTRSLLSEQDQQVVLFPEGEVYHHNDLMLPLNPGVAQIGFWALADKAKLGKPLHLPVLPIAVKYRFLGDAVGYTEKRIRRLERAVGIEKSRGDWSFRVFAIGDRIVKTLEKRYKLPHDGEVPERIERLKLTIIHRGFAALGLERKESASLPELMRALFNALREQKSEEAVSEYDQKIATQRRRQVESVLDDLNRIADSILTSGHYVSDHPTYERLGDLLGRMEDEAFGKHSRYPQREALVRVGEPVPLEEFYENYAKDKRGAVAAATTEIAARIAGMLEELASEGSPISTDLWPPSPQSAPAP
jgi:1-acyl-sn-glycerol-3-phosphate acyltransferase